MRWLAPPTILQSSRLNQKTTWTPIMPNYLIPLVDGLIILTLPSTIYLSSASKEQYSPYVY